MEMIKSSFSRFNYTLYGTLFCRLLLPTIYQTVRVSILGSLPNPAPLNISSQMVWVNVLLEIVEESLLQPLYFCLGTSFIDLQETRNKIRTGFIVCTFFYTVFSITTTACAGPLVDLMAQNKTLHSATVSYIRVEMAGIVASSLAKFLMLVIVMHGMNKMVLVILSVQMFSMIIFDVGLVSKYGADIGSLGVAYSSLATGLLVLFVSLPICWKKMNFEFTRDIYNGNYDFVWLKMWTKVGVFSGLDSLIRNAVYLIVVLRAMNTLEEQGSYWVVNTFIWSWLLLPVIPLGELAKQDIASSITDESLKMIHWQKLFPYFTFGGVTAIVWGASYPAWPFIMKTMLRSGHSGLALTVLKELVPCYVFFISVIIFNSVFYALGKTAILALKTFIGNTVIVICFVLFKYNILFENNVEGIAAIFGCGLVLGCAISVVMYLWVVRNHSTF